MDWKKECKDYMDQFAEQIPETFKSVVEPMIRKSVEKRCLDRNAVDVEMKDFVAGLFDATPPQFQGEAVKVLQELGIDVEKYIEIKEIRDQQQLGWSGIGEAFYPGNYNFNLYVTDRCNEKCIHCAADNKVCRPELTTQQWISIIEDLESTLVSQGRRGVYIWFGGEPTCRSDIRELIKYCGDHGYYQAIATNGINFDDDFAQFCVDNHMSHVFVSLDSVNPEKVDKIRGVKGAFEKAKNAIETAIRHGLFTLVTTTVMKQNIDELEEIKAFVEDLGASAYMRAVIKQRNAYINWDEIGLTDEEYKRFYEFRNKYTIQAIEQDKIGVASLCQTYDMIPFLEDGISQSTLTAIEWGAGCQACRSISGIDINGNFFPCDYPSKLTLGNVLEDGLQKIMDSQLFKDIRDRKRTGKCAGCHHLDLCGGGCRVQAECDTGDFFASMSYCWHENCQSEER